MISARSPVAGKGGGQHVVEVMEAGSHYLVRQYLFSLTDHCVPRIGHVWVPLCTPIRGSLAHFLDGRRGERGTQVSRFCLLDQIDGKPWTVPKPVPGGQTATTVRRGVQDETLHLVFPALT